MIKKTYQIFVARPNRNSHPIMITKISNVESLLLILKVIFLYQALINEKCLLKE